MKRNRKPPPTPPPRRYGAPIRAPRTLIITLESNTEEKMEFYKYRMRRSLTFGDEKIEAFNVITTQIHDIGDLEDTMDEEDKALLRKHIITWKSALSIPRHRMHRKLTDIPVSVTSAMAKPISKCLRIGRRCQLCCCSKQAKFGSNYTRPESIEDFLEVISTIEVAPSLTSAAQKAFLRRQQIFSPSTPAYLAAYPN